MPDDAELQLATRILELMIVTAWADGKVLGSEALSIQHQVAQNPLLKRVRNLAEVSRRMRARIAELALEPALRKVAAQITQRKDRELAYQCCVRVMAADGDLQAEEASVLATLQQVFEFSPMDVKRLLVTATRAF